MCQYQGASLSDKLLPAQKFYPLISAADAKAKNVSTDVAWVYFHLNNQVNVSSSHGFKQTLTCSCSQLCEEGSLDPKKVKGKIIVCLRGDNARVDKGYVAAQAGAVGMILANGEQNGDEIIADAHMLPASHVSYTDGSSVYQYINSTK